MQWGTLGIAICLAVAGLAGCLGTEEQTEDAAPTAQSVEAENDTRPSIGLAGTDCAMGGGQSVHPRQWGPANVSDIVPDPWRVADVLEDTGPQYTYSQWPKPTAPVPEEGDTWGHYHATMQCEAWTLDGAPVDVGLFGFVGAKVKTPAFAPTSADDAYLATVIATDADPIHERLQTGGVGVMHAEGGISQVGPGPIEVSMRTAHNGDYLSVFEPNELGPIEDERIRLWFQHEVANGTYSPVAVDLVREGGTHYGDTGEGYFHHQRTAHHWPLPGAYGHTAAVHYEGFDVSLEWGPAPNATLDEAYEH